MKGKSHLVFSAQEAVIVKLFIMTAYAKQKGDWHLGGHGSFPPKSAYVRVEENVTSVDEMVSLLNHNGQKQTAFNMPDIQ